MFVRFVVDSDANPAWCTGVVTEVAELQRAGTLFAHEEELVKGIFAWLNEHLPCPPFAAKRAAHEWGRHAVCWFRDDAGEPLARMWELVAVLREHGLLVRLLTTEQPGRILYEDPYQVVAEVWPWSLRGG